MKREEMDHLDDCMVARRERLRREREEAEQRVRAQYEAELQEARRRRLEEEAAIQAARPCWDEARKVEERASIQLGLVQGRSNAWATNTIRVWKSTTLRIFYISYY